MSTFQSAFATFLTLLSVSLVGCSSATPTSTSSETTAPPSTGDAHAPHGHLSEGPHHGELIELGSDAYHAELIHDDQSVTIYILNGAADKQVPIDATEITINSKRDGQPEQFQLAASPDQNDPAGQSSRFVSNDADLAGHIGEPGAEHKLVLTINKKSYRGEVAHDHDDHDGHNH